MEQPTLKLLQEYKTRILDQLHESRKNSFDFDKPVFLVSAFYVQAFRMKIAVDKTKLLSVAAVSDKQFARVKHSMIGTCFPSLIEKAGERRKRFKKLNIGRKNIPKGAIVKLKGKEEPEENQTTGENEGNIAVCFPTESI